MTIQLSCARPEALEQAAQGLADRIREEENPPAFIGPVNAPIYKINDIYRKILYIKHENYDILIQIRKRAEVFLREKEKDRVLAQYELR